MVKVLARRVGPGATVEQINRQVYDLHLRRRRLLSAPRFDLETWVVVTNEIDWLLDQHLERCELAH